jgi:hypothetical protein
MPAQAIDQSQLGVYMMAGAGVGAAIGGWPASIALARGRTGLAIGSVVVCLMAGAVGGCLFAAPLAWFLAMILKRLSPPDDWDSSSGVGYDDYQRERRRMLASRRRTVEPPDPQTTDEPYTAIGPVLVCNDCGKSTTRGPGGVIPPECPACSRRFSSRKDAGAKRRSAPRMARLAEDDVVELRIADNRPRR